MINVVWKIKKFTERICIEISEYTAWIICIALGFRIYEMRLASTAKKCGLTSL